HDYNLLLTFAEKSGAYLADVQVVVKSVKGKKGFDTVAEGPFLYASLPPGKYDVSVEYKGKKQSRTVNLGRAHEVFYWK
ncbi:MAG TPA: carboxypeptidase regulatory-like domain-containing protein, partial [Burkholderiales bacterium]|nr:carboxypeptidase regulatory-like domain-containing protein [Burkholderiales bacterium]